MVKLSVKSKIAIASVASQVVLIARRFAGVGPTGVFTRSGLRWSLDLHEGIDFSIWLLGAYEPDLAKCYEKLLPSGATVLDVGANVGAHTLRLARAVGPTGKVHAFEPTRFAIGKLQRNLSLNPELEPVVAVHHMFLGDKDSAEAPAEICASWPLGSQSSGELSNFCGLPLSTAGANSMTLDSFADKTKLEKLDFIKLDVDGHEAEVLVGGTKTIERFRPDFVVELAPFVPQASGWSFQELVSFFTSRGYAFYDNSSGRRLPADSDDLLREIPAGASLNVLARHPSRGVLPLN
jgi:FkbM family methyltransferase